MSAPNPLIARIREALKTTAPVPGSGDHGAHGAHAGQGAKPSLHASSEFSQWLPAVGSSLESQLALFAKNSVDLKSEFCLLADQDAMAARLQELAKECGWQRVATHSGGLTDVVVPALGLPCIKTDGGYDVAELERSDVGITECDALVAQTGSVLVTALSAGGRALSVLPPHHLVLARRTQMVPDLPAAYDCLRQKYGNDFPSFMSFITGPSRTGDIERILVLGAHGPKRLTILVC